MRLLLTSMECAGGSQFDEIKFFVLICHFFFYAVCQPDCVMISIQANQDADFLHALHGFPHSEKTVCAEIARQHIKELCIVFQNGRKSAAGDMHFLAQHR